MTSPGFFQRFLKMTIKQRIIIAVVHPGNYDLS